MLFANILINSKKYVNLIRSDIEKLSREFIIVSVGQFLSVVGSLVGIKILTNYLSPVMYGELALGITISTMFNQIILGPLSQATYRFWSSANEQGQKNSFWNTVAFLQSIGTIVIGFIALIISIFLKVTGQDPKWQSILIAATVLMIITGLSSTIDCIQQASRQRIIVAWHQILGQWSRPVLIIMLFLYLPKQSTTALIGYILSASIVLISQFFFLISRNKDLRLSRVMGKSREWILAILHYSWPFCVWGIFTWGQSSFDRWSLQFMGYTREVGLYTLLVQIGYTPLVLISSVVVQFLTPFIFRIAGDGLDQTRLKRAALINLNAAVIFFFASLVIFILSIFINRPLMNLLAAKEYLEVAHFLPYLILSGSLFSSGQILAISLLSRRESKDLLLPKVGTAILGMFFYVIGAKYLALTGVVYANVAFSLIFFIWLLVIILRPYLNRSHKNFYEPG